MKNKIVKWTTPKAFGAAAIIPFLCVALLGLTSCATIQSGDPVVINAERVTSLAADTFHTLDQIEYSNRAQLLTVSPAIHQYANVMRRNGAQWLESARAFTMAYKQNRTPANKASLLTAIAVLETAMTESQKYIAQAQSATPPHP